MKVWVLTAEMEYEGSSLVLSVHSSLKAAEDLKTKVEEHQRARLLIFMPDDTEDEALWDAYVNKVDAWIAQHPAQQDTGNYEFFKLVERELQE